MGKKGAREGMFDPGRDKGVLLDRDMSRRKKELNKDKRRNPRVKVRCSILIGHAN